MKSTNFEDSKVKIDYKKYENYDLSILTEGERKILLAKMKHEDLKIKDIAIICNTTQGTAQVLLSRAKSKLEGTFDFEKYKERSKKYDKEHPEKLKKRKQKYYNKNKERIKEWKRDYATEYYQKNKEKFKKYNAEYYKKNKENIIRKQKER